MKFKNKWLKEILHENRSEKNPLEYVEDTGWIRSKCVNCDHKRVVFKHNDKNYAVTEFRSGHYYESEDWGEEDESECYEVEKVTTTKYEWVVKGITP